MSISRHPFRRPFLFRVDYCFHRCLPLLLSFLLLSFFIPRCIFLPFLPGCVLLSRSFCPQTRGLRPVSIGPDSTPNSFFSFISVGLLARPCLPVFPSMSSQVPRVCAILTGPLRSSPARRSWKPLDPFFYPFFFFPPQLVFELSRGPRGPAIVFRASARLPLSSLVVILR